MNTRFIPARDGEFDLWARTFTATVKANAAGYGLSAEDITVLQTKTADWETRYSEMFQKREASKAATVRKDDTRGSYEEFLRNLARQIQADPNVDNGMKTDAGLPVRSTARQPAPVPDSAPTVEIETSNVQEHKIRFFDTNNTFRRSRPRGVFGVEIYRYIGDAAPLNDEQYSMYGIMTRMNATIQFSGEDVGKHAWYRFRYVNTRGENGPWTLRYEAMITG